MYQFKLAVFPFLFLSSVIVGGCSSVPPGTLKDHNSSVSHSEAERDIPKLRSIWRGTYLCAQGETDLLLKIVENGPVGIRAIFEFSHAPSKTKGSFYLNGHYNPSNRSLVFQADRWINQPKNYFTVDLVGNLSEDLKEYSGMISQAGCGGFRIRAVQE